jgi:glutamate N-acetyltransferase/amino-acid N-acetyltransferase
MRWIGGGVTAPRGFRAAGVSAGIKRRRQPDLALVVADGPAAAAAVFTRNRVQAAPVRISRARVRRGRARAVLINSGCANCLTGPAGWRDALALGRAAARLLGVGERDVLLASTGIIGRRLPVPRMTRALPRAVAGLRRTAHRDAARAMLTTDREPKEAAVALRLQGRTVRIGGMAKGAGMIAPSMATMLAVVTTDAQVPAALLRRLLREAAAATFNRITVDGDMSTNDTVFALASGRAGARLRPGGADTARFARGLRAVCERLAKHIVRDGEGVARTMLVQVAGARTDGDAGRVARRVANSPLVKTMLAGADPNVGRIAAAVGASGARFDPSGLEIFLGRQRVVARGEALRLDKALTRGLLARPEVVLRVHLHAGRGAAGLYGGDLTTEYVRINAGYAT